MKVINMNTNIIWCFFGARSTEYMVRHIVFHIRFFPSVNLTLSPFEYINKFCCFSQTSIFDFDQNFRFFLTPSKFVHKWHFLYLAQRLPYKN